MLYCMYCNYLKSFKDETELSNKECFICEFTNYIFRNKIEEMDSDYPCNQMMQKHKDSLSIILNETA